MRSNSVFKVVVYFFLAISVFVTLVFSVGVFTMQEHGAFMTSKNEYMRSLMRSTAVNELRRIRSIELDDGLDEVFSYTFRKNYNIEIFENGDMIFTNRLGNEFYTDYVYEWYSTYPTPSYTILYVNPEFPVYDNFVFRWQLGELTYEHRVLILAGLIISIIFDAVCFVFEMFAAGHHKKDEGVTPSLFTQVPIDVLAIVYIGTLFLGILLIDRFFFVEGIISIMAILLAADAYIIAFSCLCGEFAIRLKLGKWFEKTLFASILRGLGKLIKSVFTLLGKLVGVIPFSINFIGAYTLVSIAELVIVFVTDMRVALTLLLIEKLIVAGVIIFIAAEFKRIYEGGEALANGYPEYKVDTSMMYLNAKKHAENLNHISAGITKAVEQKMKSERMKTELITNVSHDIKTPLTSIINYSDLIAFELNDSKKETDREKIAEYADVLNRQSKKLKKLLEDLVEASKVTTGNVEINLSPCEVGVMLSQAAGEYEQRFEEKNLEIILKQPGTPVKIMADGRHLWRVFDNLFSNICKYAADNSRVYMNVEKAEHNRIHIIIKNMSKFSLDLTANELLERFVRGDKSRHVEGNGLGLSIARSLTELMQGEMDISVDGDLFKVTMSFPEIV